MIALYDLGDRPASFDFVTFLATAKTHGADHVRFVLGKWKQKNYHNPEERFKSIVEPAVALWGMTYSVGKAEGESYSHFFHKTVKAFNQFGRIEKIPVKVEPKDYITVTLRKSRNPERDSNEAEWMKFAKRCKEKVIIVRDYEERPLSLQDRMKLYAGSQMNLMVINGPLTLCIHSDAPYISMRTIGCANSGSTSPDHMKQIGITPGFQFPWANVDQQLSYLDDTCENIESEFERVKHAIRTNRPAVSGIQGASLPQGQASNDNRLGNPASGEASAPILQGVCA